MSKAIKVGDKVKYIGKDHRKMPEFYPEIGTIGIVVKEGGDTDWCIQWPKGSTSGHDRWYCEEESIELFDGKVEEEDMTNEEIWEMLRPKMEKNALTTKNIHAGLFGPIYTYNANDVHNAVALAYKVGYLRSQKGRPFKIGEEKKKGGHWEPVDPNNLPEEGTRVKLKKECCNYYGGVVESGEIGIVFHDASYVSRVLEYGVSFGEKKTIFLPLDRNIIASCFDMWVEDNE